MAQLRRHERLLALVDGDSADETTVSANDWLPFSDIVQMYDSDGHDARTGLVWRNQQPIGVWQNESVVELWKEK